MKHRRVSGRVFVGPKKSRSRKSSADKPRLRKNQTSNFVRRQASISASKALSYESSHAGKLSQMRRPTLLLYIHTSNCCAVREQCRKRFCQSRDSQYQNKRSSRCSRHDAVYPDSSERSMLHGSSELLWKDSTISCLPARLRTVNPPPQNTLSFARLARVVSVQLVVHVCMLWCAEGKLRYQHSSSPWHVEQLSSNYVRSTLLQRCFSAFLAPKCGATKHWLLYIWSTNDLISCNRPACNNLLFSSKHIRLMIRRASGSDSNTSY